MLEHARYSDCKDVEGFKAELSTLVNEVRSNTVHLGKVQKLSDNHNPCPATPYIYGFTHVL